MKKKNYFLLDQDKLKVINKNFGACQNVILFLSLLLFIYAKKSTYISISDIKTSALLDIAIWGNLATQILFRNTWRIRLFKDTLGFAHGKDTDYVTFSDWFTSPNEFISAQRSRIDELGDPDTKIQTVVFLSLYGRLCDAALSDTRLSFIIFLVAASVIFTLSTINVYFFLAVAIAVIAYYLIITKITPALLQDCIAEEPPKGG